jgi:hypothetical protein
MAEPLNATFFAFKKRERGGVLIGASITFVVLAVVLYAALMALVWVALGQNPFEMSQLAAQAQANPEAIQQMMSPGNVAILVLIYLVFMFAFCVLFAAYEAACLRWMIRGETKGLFGLALDEDTWRVYGIYWVWFIGFIVGGLAFLLFTAILGGTIAVTAGANSPVMLVLPLLFFIVPIYVSTRLAPAAATAVAERRFAFFDAWTTSRDRFWALFGAFFLLWLVYMIIACGISVAWLSWAVGPRLVEIFTAGGSDPTAVSIALNQAIADAMMAPGGMLVYIGVTVVSYLIALFFYVALFGVNARAAQAALEEGKISPDATPD